MAILPYSFYLFALSLIPLPDALKASTLLETALSRLIVLGTFIIGLLSGLGAAKYVWDYLPLVSSSRR